MPTWWHGGPGLKRLWERDSKMNKAGKIKRLIIGAAIASTMVFGLLSAIPAGAPTLQTGTAIQIAEKGSDGQETHG